MNLIMTSDALYSTMYQWNDDSLEAMTGGNPPETQKILKGATVKYLGHVPGGMIKVEYNGAEVIIHPGATNIGKTPT